MSRWKKLGLALITVALLGGVAWLDIAYRSKWSEVLSDAGSVASLLGLGYIAFQVWQTRSLMLATKEATDDALSHLQLNQYRYLLVRGSSLLSEASTHVQSRNWKIAAVRLHDVGDQCSQLANLWQQSDEHWRTLGDVARWWANEFTDGQTNRVLNYNAIEWSQFYGRLRDKFDREFDPFSETRSQ